MESNDDNPLGEPVNVNEGLVREDILKCCSGGVTPAEPIAYVSVIEAVSKLLNKAGIAEGEQVIFENNDVRVETHVRTGSVSIQWPDGQQVETRKSIGTIMKVKNFDFEETVAWMADNFPSQAVKNSASEYVELMLRDTQ